MAIPKSRNQILFNRAERLVINLMQYHFFMDFDYYAHVFVMQLLDERQSINVWRYLQAIDKRPDITEGLKKLKCRTLIFVGDSSSFHSEALHMTGKLDRRYCALVEVMLFIVFRINHTYV